MLGFLKCISVLRGRAISGTANSMAVNTVNHKNQTGYFTMNIVKKPA